MAQFAGLGLKATKLLVDQHFEKIPDRHFGKIPDPVIFPQKTFREYRHRRRRRKAARAAGAGGAAGAALEKGLEDHSDDEGSYSESGDSDRDRDINHDRGRRRDHHSDRGYDPPRYASHHDPYYPVPVYDPYAATQPAYPPSNSYMSNPYAPSNADPDASYPPPYLEEYPRRTYSPPRRSRSQNQNRGRSRDRDLRPSMKRRPSSTGPTSGLSGAFTTSDKGIGIGGLGALAGGLLTQEIALRSRKADPMLATLVGAALGGLGANYLEGKHEKKKEQRVREREKEWEREERRRW